MLRAIEALPIIYVTGHRNPDTDSIAAAVGYAELMGRVDPRNAYVPVRLGEVNTQTRWVLDRAAAAEPEFLPHVMLRVRDVMRERFPLSRHTEPVREVGMTMAHEASTSSRWSTTGASWPASSPSGRSPAATSASRVTRPSSTPRPR